MIYILGRTTSWSPKSQCVYGPKNEIAAVTFFAKNGAALPKSNTFASVTEWQDSGEHGCWLKVSSPACMSPVFAKAPCCLELFGCCCRRLLQHGVGEVLWRDAFSVFALAVDRFVTIGRRTAHFCFGPLMRCLFLGSPPFHVFECDAVVRPLCLLANLFVGVFVWALAPFLCLVAVSLDETQVWPGWGICGSSGLCVCVLFVLSWFACISGPFGSLYKWDFYCLCSCKDRATVRHRPHSKKKKIGLPPFASLDS